MASYLQYIFCNRNSKKNKFKVQGKKEGVTDSNNRSQVKDTLPEKGNPFVSMSELALHDFR